MKAARWVQSSPTTHILKAAARDGGAVLAKIETTHFRHHVWSLLPSGRSGVASSLYAAQRAVRKALREEAN